MQIDQERIHQDLDAADFAGGSRSVVYVLDEGDVVLEHFTSSKGRTHHGPATVTIREWTDGGTDVIVKDI